MLVIANAPTTISRPGIDVPANSHCLSPSFDLFDFILCVLHTIRMSFYKKGEKMKLIISMNMHLPCNTLCVIDNFSIFEYVSRISLRGYKMPNAALVYILHIYIHMHAYVLKVF